MIANQHDIPTAGTEAERARAELLRLQGIVIEQAATIDRLHHTLTLREIELTQLRHGLDDLRSRFGEQERTAAEATALNSYVLEAE